MLALAAEPAERPQIFAPGVISAPVSATAPTFFPDASNLVFEQNGAGKRRLMTSHKSENGWSDPVEIVLGGVWFYIEPALAADGSYLLVASNRDPRGSSQPLDGNWNGQVQPGRGGAIWRVEKSPSARGRHLAHCPTKINASSSNFEPALTRNGTLYFMRPGADGKFHILRAMPKNGDYEEPQQMPFTKSGSRCTQ
jgi:WD40 repeat protein